MLMDKNLWNGGVMVNENDVTGHRAAWAFIVKICKHAVTFKTHLW